MLLKVENVEKYYGNHQVLTKALDNLSFQIEKGEFIGIMGASGSGKTSLLNCISTIDSPSAGKIYLDNRSITELDDKELSEFRRENLGFIFQESRLLDTLTLEENIAMPLIIKNEDPVDIVQKVKNIAKYLKIEDTLLKFPYEVSGGQRQRCATARAVITDPKLVLADEPTGALDTNSARILMELLYNLNQELEATILLVTHDPVAASYSERILFLRDGKIFNELQKGEKSRTVFYHEILNVLSLMGGK